MGMLWTMDSSNTASRPCRASRVETDHFNGGLSRNRGPAQGLRRWPQTELQRQKLGQTVSPLTDQGVQPPREQDLTGSSRGDAALGNPLWRWKPSHISAHRLSRPYSPIRGSSTPQSLPDCLFLALVQGSSAARQPGKEDLGRFGHKLPRQVTGQASESLHICLTHLKAMHALHTQPASVPSGNRPAHPMLCLCL